jgi:hypothetical protein
VLTAGVVPLIVGRGAGHQFTSLGARALKGFDDAGEGREVDFDRNDREVVVSSAAKSPLSSRMGDRILPSSPSCPSGSRSPSAWALVV